ncbi:MAG: YHS domain-containing protein [Thermoplasmatales archaeon]
MAKDPVCGMNVSEKSQLYSEYKGKKYYFCSISCKKSFDSNPGNYVNS